MISFSSYDIWLCRNFIMTNHILKKCKLLYFFEIVSNHSSSTSSSTALFSFPPLDSVWSNNSTISRIFNSQKSKCFKKKKNLFSLKSLPTCSYMCSVLGHEIIIAIYKRKFTIIKIRLFLSDQNKMLSFINLLYPEHYKTFQQGFLASCIF